MSKVRHIIKGIGILLLILFVFSSASSFSQIISSKKWISSNGISRKDNSFSKSDFQLPFEENEENEKEGSGSDQNRFEKNLHKHFNYIHSCFIHNNLGEVKSNLFSAHASGCGNFPGIPFYLAKRHLLI